MSGFSGDWLALREPYDRIARAGVPLQLLTSWSRSQPRLSVVDLGSGTGANLRGISPTLSSDQVWTLIEIDGSLIERGSRILTDAGPPNCRWRYQQLDLAADLDHAVPDDADLITASALIDLVSQAWLDRLLALVRGRHCALYLTLSYDGTMSWDPIDDYDAHAHRLFETHQHRDKGFGAALGGDAAGLVVEQLRGTKGRVQAGASDWLFGPADVDIQNALLDNVVAAAKEVDELASPALDHWAVRRRAHIAAANSHCRVGHQDLLYLPNSRIT